MKIFCKTLFFQFQFITSRKRASSRLGHRTDVIKAKRRRISLYQLTNLQKSTFNLAFLCKNVTFLNLLQCSRFPESKQIVPLFPLQIFVCSLFPQSFFGIFPYSLELLYDPPYSIDCLTESCWANFPLHTDRFFDVIFTYSSYWSSYLVCSLRGSLLKCSNLKFHSNMLLRN